MPIATLVGSELVNSARRGATCTAFASVSPEVDVWIARLIAKPIGLLLTVAT
jgi:hypothetical protein